MANTYQGIKISLGKDQSSTFDPLKQASSREILSILVKVADVDLSPIQEKTALTILESLPRDATLLDFVKACDVHAASQLGISAEKLEAIRPLTDALRATPSSQSRFTSVWNKGENNGE